MKSSHANKLSHHDAGIFIPFELNLVIWVASVLYTGFLSFFPIYAMLNLFRDAWQAGRLNELGWQDVVAIAVLLAIMMAICWPLARWFFERWTMERMDEFWARREGIYTKGIRLTQAGVEVCNFDNNLFIPINDFKMFGFACKRRRHGEMNYLELHYVQQGQNKVETIYWRDLAWRKALRNTQANQPEIQIRTGKQRLIEQLQDFLEDLKKDQQIDIHSE